MEVSVARPTLSLVLSILAVHSIYHLRDTQSFESSFLIILRIRTYINLLSTPWWILLIWVFPSRCSKQRFFIVWESESILNLMPSYRFPKGKPHIKQLIHFFFLQLVKLVFIHLLEMFSLLLYKYIMCSAWFSLWYLLSINFLLISGYVYTALHKHKLYTPDLKKFCTVTVLSWWQSTTTWILCAASFKKCI